MKTFDIVKPYLKQSIGRIGLGILVLLAVDAIQLIIPKIMQYAIDHIQHNAINANGLALVGLAIFAMAFGIMVMRYFWRVLIIGNSFVIEAGMRQDFYNHLLRLSQNYFNRSKIGDLMAHATNDLNAVRMLFGMGFIAGSDIIIMTIASFAFMVSINFHLTMLAVIPLPILTLIIRHFGRKMHKRFAQVQGAFSSMSGAIQENITGIRVVKAFVQEKSEIEKIDKQAVDYVKQNIAMARISGVFHPMMGFVISISMILNLVFGGQATIHGDITIGEFIAFYSYLGMLVWPMIAVGMIVDMYQRGTASLKRLNKIFEEIPEVNDDKA
ncbi:MAG TPA: ABC transporter transmembrane domain-containing protein, partial [Candidatus Cloacimonadota bacterium]|nr:ABC transporter transmembrane domain-containing protein [Candidatus Cloacimonadota bacterium]